MKSKIAIFGGTFSPLHVEHVKMVEKTLDELKPEKLIIVPTQNAPHKNNSDIMPAKDRLEMLRQAFPNNNNIEISTYELDKDNTCYTFEMLLHFKEIYPESELYYVLGEDSLNDFKYWKNPGIICKTAKLFVFKRLGSDIDTSDLVSKAKFDYNAKIKIAKYVGREISSTDVFVMYQFGDDFSGVLPEITAKYVSEHKLFPDYRYLVEFTKSNITEKRLKHTYNVCLYALFLSKRLKLDRDKTFIASVLHDVGKYKDIAYAVTVGADGEFLNKLPQAVWHQYISAYMAKECLGIKDGDILNSIMYHSTGRPKMSILEKVVFVADYCERGRRFPGVETAREEVENDFEKGFCFCLEQNIRFIKESGESLCELSLEALEYEKEELKER